jgi:RNase P subunit RPR2
MPDTSKELLKWICPHCGSILQDNHSSMWTGKEKQVLRYVLSCGYNPHHRFEIMGRDIGEINSVGYELNLEYSKY